MPVGRAEVGVLPDELIERGARGARVALGELRPRKAEHEIGVVLVESLERLGVLGDRLVVALVTGEPLGVALAARDIAGDARLVLVTAQVRTRVHRAAQTAGGAPRSTAAEERPGGLPRQLGQG